MVKRDEELQQAFADRVNRLREERGLSWKELAAMVGTDVSSLWRWRSRSGPRLEAQIPELVALISQEKQLAAEFSEAVLQLPKEAREEKVRNLARVEAWPVAFALLLGALLADEPGKSASLAELAAAAAEAMDD